LNTRLASPRALTNETPATAGTGSAAGWSGEQNDLATLSSDSLHRTVAGSTHQSLIDDKRDAAQSSRAIGDIVTAVQKSHG
jgi:hypothetical protein